MRACICAPTHRIYEKLLSAIFTATKPAFVLLQISLTTGEPGSVLLLCFVFNVIGSISMNLNVFKQTCSVEPCRGCRIQKSSFRNQLVMPEQSDVCPVFVFFTFCCPSPDLSSKVPSLESLLPVNIRLQLFGRKPLTTDAAQGPQRSVRAPVISRNIFGFCFSEYCFFC